MGTVPDPPDSQSGRPQGRLFTVAEANRMLPYLRSALTEAAGHRERWRQGAEELRRIEAVGRTPQGPLILAADHRAVHATMEQHLGAVSAVLEQIAAHGCQVKDLTTGLCDFPAVIDGEPVLLCWRLDEPAVAHYHDPVAGFRGRRPLPPQAR